MSESCPYGASRSSTLLLPAADGEPADCAQAMAAGPWHGRHSLRETGLFDDESLLRVIAEHPHDDLNVITMARDNGQREWRAGSIDGLSPEQVLDAVRRGRLWLNVKRMHEHHAEWHELLNELYSDLARRSPSFRPRWKAATLLISSPSAFVYFHLDAVPNMLWHVRGKKRLWVYPAMDERFATTNDLERIMSGESDEELRYEPDFDTCAHQHLLQPGEVVAWPQNAPHRIDNVEGLNVSLSTEHLTPQASRRVDVYRANRWLRQHAGLPMRSTRTDGPLAAAKQAVFKAVRVGQRLRGISAVHYTQPVTFKVDPDATNGLVNVHASTS